MEIWKPVVGYEGVYEVSSHGRIRSLPRPYLRARAGIVRPWIHGEDGYLHTTLSADATKKKFRVHVLVAAAFLGPRPEGYEVRHLDGDRTNARLENLTYGTSSENRYDTVRHGRHHNVNKTHCPQGHPYTPENTYWWNNRRKCRECHREATRKHNQKRRARKEAA